MISVAPASHGAYYGNPGALFPPPGVTSTRPVFFSNGIPRYADSNHRERHAGYGGVGFVTLGYPGSLGLDYDPDFLNPTYNPNTIPGGVPPLPEWPAAAQPGAPEPAPPPPSPYSVAPAAQPPSEPAPLQEEDAVTIVYKDGRQPEQVRNYALTRSALYITTGRVRTIPVDQIDVPATEAINARAGVEFHLPPVR